MKRKAAPGEEDHSTKLPKTKHEAQKAKRLIIILEGARLESVKVGNEFQLLNADDHQQILRKNGMNIADHRPDIAHQCLLALLDSPLNKAGLLQVYVRTQKNTLIEINPHTRIPRTFKRFCGLMVQLLLKRSIRAVESSERLLKVIKNPVTDHLPIGCRKIRLEYDPDGVRSVNKIVQEFPEEEPVAFVIGCFASGDVDVSYCEDSISISNYPLSAAICCNRICGAFEEKWNVL
eukprot:Clim_evm36s225 gene=Clim_evmTU36s225